MGQPTSPGESTLGDRSGRREGLDPTLLRLAIVIAKTIRRTTSLALLGLGALHVAWATSPFLAPPPAERDTAEPVRDLTLPVARGAVGLGMLGLAVATTPFCEKSSALRALRRLGGVVLLARALVTDDVREADEDRVAPANTLHTLHHKYELPLYLGLGVGVLTHIKPKQKAKPGERGSR